MYAPWKTLRGIDDQWVSFLETIGGQVQRSDACFVAWLGDTQTMLIAHDDDLDADDTLAQIILHEICHHLVEGPQSWRQDDWGLDNMTDDDIDREYAALRLQAAILSTPTQRTYLQPTTDHRWFYEALASSPLTDAVDVRTDAQSQSAALEGWTRWQSWPHRAALHALLVVSEGLLSSLARAR